MAAFSSVSPKPRLDECAVCNTSRPIRKVHTCRSSRWVPSQSLADKVFVACCVTALVISFVVDAWQGYLFLYNMPHAWPL